MERQYSGSVKKTDPLGTTVAAVTAKTDRGEVVKSYGLEGADAMFFTIDNQGAIRLKDSIASVPRPELNFIARAGDSRTSTTVPVHISISTVDENAELMFEKSSYEVKVMENLPVNGYVLHPKVDAFYPSF
ncbi:hypothetical protein TELCIR_15775 [Teladorsagia circumcincta]|uniref:Cadherin domain-containing protein n=1 Tax=Teladorsagia circumcincta TaxID=45464 RepID=A0A2G9TXJ1_TELCI|nr:hypothetical protein TELCIR_15775 [Teladorsagia circumcincta]